MKFNPAQRSDATVAGSCEGCSQPRTKHQPADLLRHFGTLIIYLKVHSHGWKQNRTEGPIPVRHNAVLQTQTKKLRSKSCHSIDRS
jgi:hypothetical protein